MNRLVRANLSDGNDVQLKYNAYDDIVFAKDNHTQVAFDYTILGSLKAREQGGKNVKFNYDTEEQLTAVINEKGETYQLNVIRKEISSRKSALMGWKKRMNEV